MSCSFPVPSDPPTWPFEPSNFERGGSLEWVESPAAAESTLELLLKTPLTETFGSSSGHFSPSTEPNPSTTGHFFPSESATWAELVDLWAAGESEPTGSSTLSSDLQAEGFLGEGVQKIFAGEATACPSISVNGHTFCQAPPLEAPPPKSRHSILQLFTDLPVTPKHVPKPPLFQMNQPPGAPKTPSIYRPLPGVYVKSVSTSGTPLRDQPLHAADNLLEAAVNKQAKPFEAAAYGSEPLRIGFNPPLTQLWSASNPFYRNLSSIAELQTQESRPVNKLQRKKARTDQGLAALVNPFEKFPFGAQLNQVRPTANLADPARRHLAKNPFSEHGLDASQDSSRGASSILQSALDRFVAETTARQVTDWPAHMKGRARKENGFNS